MRFAQKVAVVTGGASGIGRACAVAFAREGAKVAVVDRSPEIGRETVSLIRERGGEAVFLQADVTEEEQLEQLLTMIETWVNVPEDTLPENIHAVRREDLRRRPQVNLESVDLSRRQQRRRSQRVAVTRAEDAVADRHRATIGPHVT